MSTVPEGSEGEKLAIQLAQEMAAAWHEGYQPLVEEYLARYPSLAQAPEAAVRLVYEEVCLREEFGEEIDAASMMERFPQWRPHLAILLDCHSLMHRGDMGGPVFPEVGEVFEGLRLRAELGRGAQGRVFLAADPGLAGRAVVLKMTPCNGHEHLSLARLQHTHIAPLYWMKELPERRLRVLCMPFLGGATLTEVLKALRGIPVEQRGGKDLVKALDQTQEAILFPSPPLRGRGVGGEGERGLPLCDSHPSAKPQAASRAPEYGGEGSKAPRSPGRDVFSRCGYLESICALGACLADALHYAHERGLVHLDVKASNVLIADDGQPMLLDFHLAREPMHPGGGVPEWFGGTPDSMSPEQSLALQAVRQRRPPPLPVDGRSDIFSLGLLLYEALSGQAVVEGKAIKPLSRLNPRVSVGLSDLIGRCLEPNLGSRYASAAEVAADLRRHLAHEPLRGVANRSLGERWRKWRRRKPHALTHAAMLLVIVAGLAGSGAAAKVYTGQRLGEAEAAWHAGEQQLGQGEFAAAETTLERGLELARNLPGGETLAQDLAVALARARRAQAAESLHGITKRVLFLHDPAALREPGLRRLDENCRAVWKLRDLLRDASAALVPDLESRIETDLLDLALCWADLKLYLKRPGEAVQIATEAEQAFGPSAALARLRQRCCEAAGDSRGATMAARQAQKLPVRTAWEHARLGQTLLRAGQLEAADEELRLAVQMQSDGFWGHYYQGVTAYRCQQFDEAATAFRVCVALMPQAAECHHNLALAFAALGKTEQALHSCDRALELEPHLAVALLNRAVLRYRERRFDEALMDLGRAWDDGADPATVLYNRALIELAQDDRAAALANLRRALEANPSLTPAKSLLDQMR